VIDRVNALGYVLCYVSCIDYAIDYITLLERRRQPPEEGDVIANFKDKRTRRFADGESVKEFRAFEKTAETRLFRLDAASSLEDLARVPGNQLEALRGDRRGQHSIRINRKWRICFVWNDTQKCAEDVEIVDYH
jgi:proteic killer suppression protein